MLDSDLIFSDDEDIQATMIRISDREYPQHMKEVLGSKSPEVLYARGNMDILQNAGIGFCGSRKAEELALAVTRDCTEQIVESGLNIISGYAAGVDMAAHYTALERGGKTIIVLPEGIDQFRIKKHLTDVWDWGRVLVISQYEPDAPWKVWRAMERNKTIMALSKAMIVISAGEKGGTLDAGLSALRKNFSLYVADYQNSEEIAPGNKILLQQGAKPLFKNGSESKLNLSRLFEELQCGPAEPKFL